MLPLHFRAAGVAALHWAACSLCACSPATTSQPQSPAASTAPAASQAPVPPSAKAPAALLARAPEPNPPLIGHLGRCELVSGEVLEDCRVEYRILGQANANRSNVVVFPTWFGGVTKDLVARFEPGKLIDTQNYQVILVGALANGVSSSPSNSPKQPRRSFPKVTLRDMVNAQHRLLTTRLGLSEVKAVAGISMGGMQAFEWAVAYPNYMEAVVPIAGSPKLAAYDEMLWQASLDAIAHNPDYHGGNYTAQPVLPVVEQLAMLALWTPGRYNRDHTRAQFRAWREGLAPSAFDANDRVRQLEAMLSHDVSATFGGSMDQAAQAVQARLLVVVNQHDQMVTPGAAVDFAERVGAAVLRLSGDCGHKADECEIRKIGAAIAAHLEGSPDAESPAP